MTVNNTKVNSTEFSLSNTALKKIEEVLKKSNRDSRNLIQILQDLQEEFHYLPEKVISHISQELQISEHHVYGVACKVHKDKTND